MRFLLDVNIGSRIAAALVDLGHNVVRSAIVFPTESDEYLLDLAVRETRIIITEDSDFTDLIYAFGAAPPPAILYLRCEPREQPSLIPRIIDVIASPRLDRHMVVMDSKNNRFRPLPIKSNENG